MPQSVVTKVRACSVPSLIMFLSLNQAGIHANQNVFAHLLALVVENVFLSVLCVRKIKCVLISYWKYLCQIILIFILYYMERLRTRPFARCHLKWDIILESQNYNIFIFTAGYVMSVLVLQYIRGTRYITIADFVAKAQFYT